MARANELVGACDLFLAIGTAVRHEGSQGAYRTPDGKPFTSDLSGQDFWTILNAGYRPLGFVMGNCVFYVGPPAPQSVPNGELAGPTQALAAPRSPQAHSCTVACSGYAGCPAPDRGHPT